MTGVGNANKKALENGVLKSSAVGAGGFRSHQKSNSVLNTPSPTKPLGRGALAQKSPFEEATPQKVESS